MNKAPILKYSLLFISGLFILSGCAVTDIGSTLKGDHYLMTRDYTQGEQSFRQSVRSNPESASNNYYLGRFLLAEKKAKQALPYLRKAVRIAPDNADYHFWLGVAYGATGKTKSERTQYRKALQIEPKHVQALIYLGNNQLKIGQYQKALNNYHKALKLSPANPTAMYNRGLIMKILGRTPEERVAWLQYLSWYPAGDLAIRATNHLNRLGDFSYRNHYIGKRTLTLTKIWFRPFEARLDSYSFPSLNLVGATASNMKKGTLQVVVYQKNDKRLAKQRAISIKKYLLKNFPVLRSRIGISWFAKDEIFTVEKKKQRSGESVRFFLTHWK